MMKEQTLKSNALAGASTEYSDTIMNADNLAKSITNEILSLRKDILEERRENRLLQLTITDQDEKILSLEQENRRLREDLNRLTERDDFQGRKLFDQERLVEALKKENDRLTSLIFDMEKVKLQFISKEKLQTKEVSFAKEELMHTLELNRALELALSEISLQCKWQEKCVETERGRCMTAESILQENDARIISKLASLKALFHKDDYNVDPARNNLLLSKSGDIWKEFDSIAILLKKHMISTEKQAKKSMKTIDGLMKVIHVYEEMLPLDP